MPFLTQGKTNWRYILIVVILAVIVGGGILAWRYLKIQRAKTPLSILVEKIEQGQVKSITIRDHEIEALLKDGTYLYSKKEKGISLTEALLNYGVSPEKLKNIEIKITQKRFLSVWILPLLLFIFPIIIVFLVAYFLILVGFKILHITGIPKSKIIVYVIATFLLGWFLNSLIPIVFKDIPNKFILYSVHILIYFLFVFLLLKYYFHLFGKKLWQFLLYLIALSLIFSGIMTLLQSL